MADKRVNELQLIAALADDVNVLGDGNAQTYRFTIAQLKEFLSAAFTSTFALVPVGTMVPFAGPVAPSGYLMCFGQAVSRATYAPLFEALTIRQTGSVTNASANVTGLADTSNMRVGMPISGNGIQAGSTIASIVSGTAITITPNANATNVASEIVVAPFGVGDGTTTFNLPDLRGRAIAGVDNMGGTAASRLTAAASGVAATRIGGAGGAETHVLTTAQMPSHGHTTNTVGDHNHTMYGQVNTAGGSAGTARIATYANAPTGTGTQVTLPANGGAMANNGAHSHTVNNTGSNNAHNNTQPTLVVNYLIKT